MTTCLWEAGSKIEFLNSKRHTKTTVVMKYYPLSFFFKAYRIICKKLDVMSLEIHDGRLVALTKHGYENVYENDNENSMYPIYPSIKLSKLIVFTKNELAMASKYTQKAIVMKIMTLLKKKNIRTASMLCSMSSLGDKNVLPQGTSIERLVIEYDLRVHEGQ